MPFSSDKLPPAPCKGRRGFLKTLAVAGLMGSAGARALVANEGARELGEVDPHGRQVMLLSGHRIAEDHGGPLVVEGTLRPASVNEGGPGAGHRPLCLLYTSDAADDLPCVDLGGRRCIKKKQSIHTDDTPSPLIHSSNTIH